MPYTQEELKNISFYQNLIDEDEQRYLMRKALLEQQSNLLGLADNVSLLSRDESGAVLIFEDPYANQLNEDPSTKIIYNNIIKCPWHGRVIKPLKIFNENVLLDDETNE